MPQHPLCLSASRSDLTLWLNKQLPAFTRVSMRGSRRTPHTVSSKWFSSRVNSTKQEPEPTTNMVKPSNNKITVTSASQNHSNSSSSGGSSGTGSSSSDSSGSSRLTLLLGLVAVATVILVSSGGFGGLKDRVKDLEELIAASGYIGPVIFASSYAAATVLLFPASLLTLAAGYLFGPVKGTALVSVSATGGACLAFLVSRYLARPAVEAKLAEYPKFQAVNDGISKDGAKLVLLLRLSPLIPFSLLNYFLGVTKVGFTEYAVASWLGMLPGTFAYVYLGTVGKVAADAAGGADAGGLDPVKITLYVVGAFATVWATKLISNAAATAINTDGRGDDDS